MSVLKFEIVFAVVVRFQVRTGYVSRYQMRVQLGERIVRMFCSIKTGMLDSRRSLSGSRYLLGICSVVEEEVVVGMGVDGGGRWWRGCRR